MWVSVACAHAARGDGPARTPRICSRPPGAHQRDHRAPGRQCLCRTQCRRSSRHPQTPETRQVTNTRQCGACFRCDCEWCVYVHACAAVEERMSIVAKQMDQAAEEYTRLVQCTTTTTATATAAAKATPPKTTTAMTAMTATAASVSNVVLERQQPTAPSATQVTSGEASSAVPRVMSKFARQRAGLE